MSSSTHSRVQSRPIRKIISIDKEVKSHVDEALRSDGPTQHLTEVDREWYNIRIGDLEAKLKRSVDDSVCMYFWSHDIFLALLKT